jgi:hypothetical protein
LSFLRPSSVPPGGTTEDEKAGIQNQIKHTNMFTSYTYPWCHGWVNVSLLPGEGGIAVMPLLTAGWGPSITSLIIITGIINYLIKKERLEGNTDIDGS